MRRFREGVVLQTLARVAQCLGGVLRQPAHEGGEDGDSQPAGVLPLGGAPDVEAEAVREIEPFEEYAAEGRGASLE